MRKRQSELHGNMQKAAEMTASAKRVIEAVDRFHMKGDKSVRDVAKILGMEYGAMCWFMKRHNIPRKTRLQSLLDKYHGHGPNWIGGRTIFHPNRGGVPYVYIFKPEHPNANTRGYIFEHRFVMAEKIGRALETFEVVHHVNGDTLDNRPENLEVRYRGGKHQHHGPLTVCPGCGRDLLRG